MNTNMTASFHGYAIKIASSTITILYLLFSICTLTVIISAVNSESAHAADTAGFNAGRIIDDSVFTNNGSMSVNDIQIFLNSKVSQCDTNGTQPASEYGRSDLTHAQYAASKGWPGPPYTCLKSYSENGATSAQIIYNTAQQYQINPQVLIVLLQKEQGLVTDTWPLPIQYRSATGYGCPDTAPCDSQYYGLTNQVNWSARMFRAILNNSPTWYTPYILGNNYIQYNPNSSCGGTNVNITNRSTQALYNYTPYQPNQAALDAGYGVGNNCSAHGNRNFYLYFTDWFGSTKTPSYRWQPISQSAHLDSTQSTNADLTNFIAANPKRVYLTVKVQNNGTATWSKNFVNLGTSNPQDRNSNLYDSTWISRSRPATLNESSVAPGQYGTFSFWANSPISPGNHKEYFNVVAEGVTWMNDMGLYYQFDVQPAKYTWQSESQNAYTDASKQTSVNLLSSVAGERIYMSVKARNTGNTTWIRGNVNLATSGPNDRISKVRDSTWLSGNRVASLQEQTIPPGELGTFEYWTNPQQIGSYREYFNLVAENKGWMTNIGFYDQYNVTKAQYTWQPVSQTSYTDQTKSTPVNTSALSPGQRVFLEIKAKNTGNVTWRKNNLNLATNGPQNRSSAFYDPAWLSNNRPTSLQEDTISPGQTGTFGFWVKAPGAPGTSKEYFNFVAENTAWLTDLGLYYTFTVQ